MSYGDYALSGGTLRVMDGVSVVYNTYALSSGTIDVTAGGTASIVSVGGSGIQVISGASASGTVEILDGKQIISAGGVGIVSSMVTGNAAKQEIFSGGTGTISSMNQGNTQIVFSGGTGTVSSMYGGIQTVNPGASATVSTMYGGRQDIGYLNASGGMGTIVTMSGGVQNVSSGGTGTVSALMSGGLQIVYGGACGGTSKDTHVMSGGVLEENGEGAIIDNATFASGGIHRLVVGATQSGTTFSGHILELGDGGTAISVTVGDGGTVQAAAGGVADAWYFYGVLCEQDYEYDRAVEAYEAGDAAGSALCTYALGNVYRTGITGVYDFAKAQEYYNSSDNLRLYLNQ